jgi:peptide/nickel transport system permease protein
MLRYILRRILLFIPALFVISLLAFLISTQAPGDPVEMMMKGGTGDASGNARNSIQQRQELHRQLGLHLPVFYFSLGSYSDCDTLSEIPDKKIRENAARLIHKTGNSDGVMKYIAVLIKSEQQLQNMTSADVIEGQLRTNVLTHIRALLVAHEHDKIQYHGVHTLASISAAQQLDKKLNVSSSELQSGWSSILFEHTTWKTYIPVVHWHGYNQYHRWLFGDSGHPDERGRTYTEGAIRGDFGYSLSTKLSVATTIKEALPWSIVFSVCSIILAYAIAVPIGVWSAMYHNSRIDKISSYVLFTLYSLPVFFVATLLLFTFANPDVFNWFPASGVKPAMGYPDQATWLDKLQLSLPHLVLPLICYTYSSLAFLSRTTRVSILEIARQDFIRTAQAKGLSPGKVFFKHALRNALLPLITVFAGIFPMAVGGSVIIEFIFTIPGMGREILQAVSTKDYPMIVAVFTLSGTMTLIGYLFADILYAWADPRIQYEK